MLTKPPSEISLNRKSFIKTLRFLAKVAPLKSSASYDNVRVFTDNCEVFIAAFNTEQFVKTKIGEINDGTFDGGPVVFAGELSEQSDVAVVMPVR